MPSGLIQLRKVAVHNLKEIDLDLPKQALVVLCGVSGSGKTSLALDTLYAEGQRRYIETFSLDARQFLQRLDKPQAERIDGLPVTVAVRGREASSGRHATVGSVTEAVDYLRLLFVRCAELVCPGCGRPVRITTPGAAAAALWALPAGSRVMIGFPVPDDPPGDPRRVVAGLRAAGFTRILAGGRWQPGEEGPGELPPEGPLEVVLDRLVVRPEVAGRLHEALEMALQHGQGQALAWFQTPLGTPEEGRTGAGVPAGPLGDAEPAQIAEEIWRKVVLRTRRVCAACRRTFADPEPRRFSFQSPLGACPACEGAGVLPGAVRKRQAWHSPAVCPACGGTRLHAEARAWRLEGDDLPAWCRLTIQELHDRLRGLKLDPDLKRAARPLLPPLLRRVRFLQEVGLGYLTLDRPMATLSTGEAQRVALTTAISSSLVNVLYVLDEPSEGLHPRDVPRLVAALRQLKERGNSVLVVDHEEAILHAADQVIELGPGAGDRGGTVVFQGSVQALCRPGASLTGEYLAGRRGVALPARRRTPSGGWIELRGARGRNLKNLTVAFPLNVLCVVSGVSGAGKSTLVEDTLYPAICRRKHRPGPPPLPYDELVGCGQIEDCLLVDQAPLGRSPRSCPVTYVKALDPIREVFAQTLDARVHNYPPGHFSFNREGGRCETCQGEGLLHVDMQFLPDVTVRCPQCGGTRYRREILAVKYRGQSIADVLAMNIRQAFGFFRGQSRVQARLKPLMDVGLDYLLLGQPVRTLSAGEAQRLKLAAQLAEGRRQRTLFILDEPTTGLHFADVVTLLDCFENLLSVGHSLIVIEHNLQLIRAADYVIDLGPEGGDAGGQVVACGTPEEVARVPHSHTGRALAASLARGKSPV